MVQMYIETPKMMFSATSIDICIWTNFDNSGSEVGGSGGGMDGRLMA